jgi:hypothetical protein
MARITAKYFTEAEFRRCTPPCSLQDMDQQFIRQLDAARASAGIPFVLNSAYRSLAWELSKGRSAKGDHPQGRGVDIRCNTSANRMKIVRALLDNGFRRIGIANTYVHAGLGKDLPQDVMWDYYD